MRRVLRGVLGFLAACVAALVVMPALNSSATSAHPMGRLAALCAFVTVLLSIATMYCGFVCGLTHRATVLAERLALAGIVGVLFHWILVITALCVLAAGFTVWLALRSPAGRRELAALVSAILLSSAGCWAASVLVDSDSLGGLAPFALLLLIQFAACALGRRTFVRTPTSPSTPEFPPTTSPGA